MVIKDKVDKKKGAIFRMEEVDGKLYRVMYFKNDKGGLTRSKFIREVQRKEKKPKGKRGRPKNSKNRAITNTKLILENRSQINNNTRNINTPQRQVQESIPQRQVQVRRTPPVPRKPAHKYVKPSGASQNIIDEWKSKIKRR